MSLTITDVVSEFGAYFRKEGQGAKDILKSYYQPSVTEAFFNPLPTEQTQERRVKSIKSRVLQRYQEAFTKVGGATFKPATINLAWMKIDEQEILDSLEKSWLGFLTNLDTNDRKKWPFVKWYMEQILAQAKQDYELNEVYAGVEGTVTPGTATAAGASMDGLGEQIADAITATRITPVNGPAVAWDTVPEDFVTEVEDWVDAVVATSNEHRLLVENEVDYLFMSTSMFKRYARGLRIKYNGSYEQVELPFAGNHVALPMVDTNIMVVGLPSMGSSDRVFMTPKENRAAFNKKPKSASMLEIESVDRSIKIFGDIWKGIGFWYPEYVFCNQLA